VVLTVNVEPRSMDQPEDVPVVLEAMKMRNKGMASDTGIV
jgi:hypothetical protein